uniref:Virion structural protein n=1 Tax=Pseudomonas phage RVTF4 TaxID=3236931 RepID=A0AB39CD54_9VIRU
MKALYVMDRPDSPRNIDLFRLWDGSRHFREVNLYDLNDLLSDNYIIADEKFNLDSENFYRLEVEVVPMARTEHGTLKILGRKITTYHPTDEDIEDLLGLHTVVNAAVINNIMQLGLRVREPDFLQEAYLAYGQLRGSIDPIVCGIGTYVFTDDRYRMVRRTRHLKITVAMMLKPGLLDEIVKQVEPQVFQTDNWGNLDHDDANDQSEDGHITTAGIGAHELFHAIKERSFDQVVYLNPGLE